MGFIKIEKDNKVNNKYIKDFSKELSTKDSYNDSNINYPKTPDVSLSENIDTAKNNGLYSEASITNLNNNDTKEYSYNFSDNSGMNGDELKVERDLVSTCGLTFIKIIIFTAVILGLLYLGFGYLDSKVSLFPYQSSYTAKEFNEYLRRSFLLMFLILSFGCSLVMVIITNIVTKEFKRNYLSKLNVYIYDVFTVLLNV